MRKQREQIKRISSVTLWALVTSTKLSYSKYWEQRVEYKLSVLVYRCLHNLAPEYLSAVHCR